jgi:predicted carbohydrate-binding protein with CBM48
MFDPADDVVERAARQLRRPVAIDPALDGRIMREITAPLASAGGGMLAGVWRWLMRPRHFTLTPLAGLGAAAALVTVFALSRAPLLPLPRLDSGASRVWQFVLLAPRAHRVSLVGDFNNWDAERTPMLRPGQTGALWTAVVPLAPGRYRYAFLVDGATWLADPTAPRERDDEFGAPSSVVTVGGS